EGEGPRLLDNGPRRRLGAHVGLVALDLVEPRLERLAVLLEVGLDGPVLLRHEAADLFLALANQPQGDGLHPARRQARLDALPQERRRIIAEQLAEHTAVLMVVQFDTLDVYWMSHGV